MQIFLISMLVERLVKINVVPNIALHIHLGRVGKLKSYVIDKALHLHRYFLFKAMIIPKDI